MIDVGINRLADGSLVGDVGMNRAQSRRLHHAGTGGVGPMTVASLMENTLSACQDYHDA